HRQALQAFQKLVTDFPISHEYRTELAIAQFKLANLLWGPLRRRDEALATYRQSINQRQQAAVCFEGQGSMRAVLGDNYALVAEVIARDPKRTPEAEDLRGRAETTFRNLIDDYPDNSSWPLQLAHKLRAHAYDSWQLQPPDGAMRLLQEAIDVLEKSTSKF